MPPRNRADPRYSSNVLNLPSSSNAVMQRRNVARSPRPQPSPKPIPPPPPPAPTRRMQEAAKKSSLEKEEVEELECLVNAAPFGKKLSKQLSMSETHRDAAWEKRRNSICVAATMGDIGSPKGEKLTDADLHELKGSIELGFGFNEEDGQKLCNTLPALDLYFAVNRQLSASPVTTPRDSHSPRGEDCWRICGKGDDPQQVKTNLRHWAQAVACSIMQTY